MLNVSLGDFSNNIFLYFFFFLIIGLLIIWNIIGIIAKWNSFKSCDRFGWEALLPIYSDLIFCKINNIKYRWIFVIYLVNIVPLIIVIYLGIIIFYL